MRKKLRIGEMLLEAGILTRQQLEEALNAQLIYGGKLGTNLVEHGFVTEEFLTSFLSKQCNMPAAEPKDLEDIPSSVIETLPRELADRHKVMPFRRDKRRLDLALVDPTNVKVVDDLAFKSGLLVRPYVAPEVLIHRALERYYQIAPPRRYIQVHSDGADARSRPEISDSTVSHELELTGSQRMNHTEFVPSSSSNGLEVPRGLPDAFPDRPMTLSQVVYDLQSVESSAQIISLILRFSRPYFQKRGIFVLRAECFERIAAEGPADFERKTQKLRLPIKEPNIFHTIFLSKRYHLGTIPPSPENFQALEQLGEEPSSPVFLLPLVFNQRTELLLIASGFTPQFTMDHVRRFQMLMEKAGFAHQIMLLKNRLRLLPDDLQ
jgi:Type II secretion system (T2SS), protein E, N-terminal domain